MDRPAKVAGIRGEIGAGIMLIPVLAETIGLPIFPTVSVPVGAVEAFNKRGIDRMTDGRERQGFFQPFFGAKLQPGFDVDHPSIAARFMHRCVEQIGRRNRLGGARSSRFTGAGDFLLYAIRREDLRSIGAVFVTGQQTHHPSSRPTLSGSYQSARLLLMPFTWYHFQHQTMLGIKSDMVPALPSILIRKTFWIAPSFFLINKGPFFIKLDLFGQGGKAPPPRHECVPHDRPPAGSDDIPYFDGRLPDVPSAAPLADML